jgi:hypothetical protein
VPPHRFPQGEREREIYRRKRPRCFAFRIAKRARADTQDAARIINSFSIYYVCVLWAHYVSGRRHLERRRRVAPTECRRHRCRPSLSFQHFSQNKFFSCICCMGFLFQRLSPGAYLQSLLE